MSNTEHTSNQQPRDAGFSLVESLVAIMLVGTLAVSGMIALRTTVIASRVDRDHANAHAWLQTASDVLYGADRVDCGTPTVSNEPTVRSTYQDIVRTTVNPQGWAPENISIVPPVLFWDGQSQYQTTCYDDAGINLQLITIQVTDPGGKIIESVQIVKG